MTKFYGSDRDCQISQLLNFAKFAIVLKSELEAKAEYYG